LKIENYSQSNKSQFIEHLPLYIVGAIHESPEHKNHPVPIAGDS